MKQSVGGKSTADANKRRSGRAVPSRGRSAANIATETDAEQDPDQPLVEGAQDAIDPDLRHRMISESAHRRYAERGYADGYDVDDWLEAEAEVDHLLSNRPLQS